MLLLTTTTDKLSMITSAAVTVDVHASGQDKNQSTGALTDYRLNTAISTAATTDIVAVPGSTTTRNVKTLHIRNKSASAATDVTVQYNQNGTLYELHKVTLNAGELLSYVEGVGFFKTANLSALDREFVVASDVTFATAATFADITGLTCPLLSGKKYNFLSHLYHISNATTTGAQFGVNIGAAPTALLVGTIDTVTASVTASVHSAGTVTARDTAVTAQTTGSAAVTLAIISGFIQPSADGTFAMRATSEVTVASGLIVKAGSWLRIWEAAG